MTAHSEQKNRWIAIAEARGLVLHTDVSIELGGETLLAPVVLRGYGAEHGMVIVSDYSLIAEVADRLVHSGFGYSCVTLDDRLDDDSFDEMLKDWGATDATE